MDSKEILRTTRELELRYSIKNDSVIANSRSFELNTKVFATEAVMMETLMNDYHHSLICTKYIGMLLDFNIRMHQEVFT